MSINTEQRELELKTQILDLNQRLEGLLSRNAQLSAEIKELHTKLGDCKTLCTAAMKAVHLADQCFVMGHSHLHKQAVEALQEAISRGLK